MKDKKILIISPELIPYLPQTEISMKSFQYSKLVKKEGAQIRIFTPRYGLINERRHKLYEVIRLSGINLVINDIDNPLIIKVASIPQEHIQVYFIENEDYFKRKGIYRDENDTPYVDNDERMIFFTKGVVEIVKKLNWAPNMIHLHGWFTALFPLYIKKYYESNPLLQSSKIVTFIYKKDFNDLSFSKLRKKVTFDLPGAKRERYLQKPNYESFCKLAISYSDGVIFDEETPVKIKRFASKKKIPFLDNQKEEINKDTIEKFYQKLIEN